MRRSMGSAALLVLAAWQMASSNARADYASAVLADKPIGYWRFNEAGNVAKNLGTGGAALDGEFTGGERVVANSFALVDGRQVTGLGVGNSAVNFGTTGDDYVTIPESILNDLGQFTMSAWINPAERTGNRIGLFGQNDAVEFGFIAPNVIQMWTPQGGQLDYTVNLTTQLPYGTWAHLAAVADGSLIKLYLNGERVSPGPSYGSSPYRFNIGGGGIFDATGNQFTGTVDEIALFNKALSQSQIQKQISEAQKAGGSYSTAVLADAPIGYWNLNDTEGTVATNLGTGGAKLNGTFSGGNRAASGPNESLPGFGADNRAFSVEAPARGLVSVTGSPMSGLGAFTMSGWVKTGTLVNNRIGLFGQNDTVEFGFINPTTLQMWTPAGGYVDFPLSGEVPENEWVHIAAVGTGEELMIYVNGELGATGGNPIARTVESYGASGDLFKIGGGGIYDTSGNQFPGLMDEVAVWDKALTDEQIRAQFKAALASGPVGDFNGNGSLDAADLDLQANAIGGTNFTFDLNGDRKIDVADRRVWVNDLKKTYMGDSNLDGVFNSSDLVGVFAAGKFESNTLALWTEGDWDGDKKFSSSDFVEAFQNGGYEAGPRAAVSSVPEPTSAVLFALGLLGLARRRR